MPRKSSSRAAPRASSSASRPSARPASSQAVPPQHAPAQPMPMPVSSGGGNFGNFLSTAAGVGVGSAIGHTLGRVFTGESAPAAPAEVQSQPQQTNYEQEQRRPAACESDMRNFTNCMDKYNNDMTICEYYLTQLKACQEVMFR